MVFDAAFVIWIIGSSKRYPICKGLEIANDCRKMALL